MKTKQPDATLKMNFNRRPPRWRPGLLGGLGTPLLLLLFLPLVLQAQTIVWQDDFESPSATNNWSMTNSVWQIGRPLTGPPLVNGQRAHQQTNCAATVLNGNYPANTSSRLSRNLSLVVPDASQNPRLEFWHWYQFSGTSYGVVQIKIGAAGAWTDLSPRYYATGSGVWTRPVVDLKAYASTIVYIAFQIVADGNVADGWCVDEVRYVKGDYTVGFTNNLVESFELGLGDWSAESGTWEVGVPTSGPPTNALGQRAYAGTNCAATVLSSNYASYVDPRLISPAFVVPASNNYPRLRFWQWFRFAGPYNWGAGNYDEGSYGYVEIKAGTNNWQAISPQNSNNTSSGVWSQPSIDLTPYAGQTAQVAFRLHSARNTDVGWYVDNVAVVTGTPVFNSPEGFELGMGDWSAESGTWEVGVPTSGPPTNALGQRAYAGTNCAATVLSSNYASYVDSRLISPAFVVPASNNYPRLRFWQWFRFAGPASLGAGASDEGSYGYVEIKAGTNNWQTISPQNYNNTSSGVWTRPSIDLQAYAGQSVQVAFHFHSAAHTDFGWYVDDVAVVTGTPVFNNPEGFELGLGDWSAERGTWEVGVPTSGPTTNALGQRAYAETNCAATVLGGNYASYVDSRLISPAFVVPSIGHHPHLRFWHWFRFAGPASLGAGAWDEGSYGYVEIKAGTNSWQQVSSTYTLTSGGVWGRPDIDLGFFAGQTVQAALHMHSAYNTDAGWVVDEVVVTSGTPPTGIVEFTDARYFVNEGGTNATITVERKYGSAGAVEVNFMASRGSAACPADFDCVSGTLSWADGEQGVKTFAVHINKNTLGDSNTTVSLELIVPDAVASVAARETATLVIIDDDSPQPLTTNIAYLRSLVGTANYVPTNTTSLFTVDGTVTTYGNLSSAPADELFFMQDNTNGIAVLFRGGTNQFMPQAGDRLRVTASLTNINGLLALAPNYANITNAVRRLSSGNSLPTKAALDFASRTNVPAMEAMEARYVIATNVWISQSGGGSFPTVLTNLLVTNQAGRTFALTIHPNTDIAGQFKPTGPVTILGVVNQNDPTAPYTTNYALLPTRYADISTNDPGVIQFVATNFVVLESGPAVTLSVSRTRGSNGTVNASFTTTNGTAVAGADFIGTNGVLSWADGEGGAKTFTVQMVNDSVEEPDELFTVGLTGATVGANAKAFITIVNDDFVATPAWQALPAGATATMSVTPTANTLGFQWWKDGVIRPNATNTTLTITNIQPGDAGTYWVVVTTTAGAVTSSVAVLVIAVPPTITVQPQSQTAPVRSYVAFSVGVSGTAPFTYQWLREGLPLAGRTNATLVFQSVQFTDAGNYSVVVNNLANQPVPSSNAVLTVEEGGSVPTNGLGSYIMSNGCYIVTGSGDEIGHTKDEFFFVYQPLDGDGQIIAQLNGLVPDNLTNLQSEAGIMIRDGWLTGGERHVFLAKNASNQVVLRRRPVANFGSLENAVRGTNTTWLRLMRMGDTFIGHSRTNGGNWEMVWWTTLPGLSTNLQAGLAVTAHRNTGLATATFCNWSVGGLTPIPDPWPEMGPRIWLGAEPFAHPPMSQLGGFKMLIGGAVGDQFAVLASPVIVCTNVFPESNSWHNLDMITFTNNLGTVTNTYGVVRFLVRQALTLTNIHRFYRLQKIGP